MNLKKVLLGILSLLTFFLVCACGRIDSDMSVNEQQPSVTAETDRVNTVLTDIHSEISEADMDKQTIIERYRAIQQAMIDKDIDALDEIILDGTVFRHMSGKTQTKAEYFADIASGRLDYQSYTMSDATVTLNGNDATLTARVVLTANAYGAQGSWPFNVNVHFIKIDGKWYMTN